MGAYFGDPGQGNNGADSLTQLLPIFHEIKNRELHDYEMKGRINQDLAIRQERQRLMFDPATGMGKTTNNEISKGINNANPEMATAVKEDLTPQDKAKFGLEKSAQDIEKSKIAQQGKLGEERVGVQKAQEELNATKNENIHNIKMADMQRKVDEATQRMGLAYSQLEQRGNDSAAHLDFMKAKAAADEARFNLELTRRDAAHEETVRYHNARIDEANKRLEAAGQPTIESTEVNADGTHKTVTKSKGENKAYDSNTTYRMKGKDGKAYMVSGKDMDKAKKDGLTEFPTTATGQ